MVKAIMKGLLRLFGWKLVGEFPEHKKQLVIFAPHTSNWDFVFMMMARFCFDMKPAFLGKHTLFKAPYGWFFRLLGGIPVDRSSSHKVVDQIIAVVEQREEVALVIAPEGTRSKTAQWKSGFYHIASKAKLPLTFAFLDTTTKTLGFGGSFELSGDMDSDMEVIRNFYNNKVGIKAELASDIRIKRKE